jgi:Zn ribbon nucleic-acid-binding protein
MQWMKDADLLKMIEGIPDVITPAVEARRRLFAHSRCPACGGNVQPEVTVDDMRRVRADEVVPCGKARCVACGCLFNVDTGLIFERGKITNLLEPAIPILGED